MEQPNDFAVQTQGLGRAFDGKQVLAGVDLTLAQGQVIALLGPSGCGKTTLLRIVAGLLAPSSGRVIIGGKTVADHSHSTPPEARGLGMVFQDYALWPHMTVMDNVGFPLRMRGTARAARHDAAADALRLVGLDHLAGRFPGTLSGGQQQRVALARAVVARPPLVLFDEPLSNLDRELRETLALDIGALLRELGLSALYVTHDQSEAFTIADRVAVMLDGRIAQIDTPQAIFDRPASLAVARFLNIGTILDGQVRGGRFQGQGVDMAVQAEDGPAHLLIPRRAVRPATGAADAQTVVDRCQFQGDRYVLHLRAPGGGGLICLSDRPMPAGAALPVTLSPDLIRVFPTQPHDD
ncbi:ABC transporter ATP-binding protein [Paracoccus sp. (in: a-proteobacteria)]|uniref:ABC transporter ATP-binding protein n=1 Tax=Paracoccus sp. TaxID=267 RepID=UPI0026DF0347|nr:ABC transporter ATP-binding protein [Paracoccus sp. (in: a-proteobacteria)]MDO5647584.1 ABC transporter ATP-binding protein [Paracoccus sp. (in: a-proteobacteria)]